MNHVWYTIIRGEQWTRRYSVTRIGASILSQLKEKHPGCKFANIQYTHTWAILEQLDVVDPFIVRDYAHKEELFTNKL